MVTSLQDDDVVAVHEVDKSVFLADSTRPAAGEGVAQRFGFADSLERVSEHVVDEPVDPLERRAAS